LTRNTGIGRALVDSVLKALKEEGINKTALVVFADNMNGRKFWESMGFSLREDLAYMDMSLSSENK
jgi:ribosomal protein S18 acetylase RimI-like enzyme